MNLVNLDEITYIVEREQCLREADEIFAELCNEQPSNGRPSFSWLTVDTTLVRQASRIKALGGSSYADGFAAASAELLDREVVGRWGDEECQTAERRGI